MNTHSTNRHRQGYALLMVLGVIAVGSIVLAATISRSVEHSSLNARSTDYTVALNAAEAATEKAYARLSYDFQNYGSGLVANNLSLYRTNIPSETAYWTNFVFSDAQGNVNQTYVAWLTNYSGSLPSQYPGLSTSGAPIYRILSNAKPKYSKVVAAVQEDVLLALVPITQYAIFYNGLLEFSTCATMFVNGRVHANGNIYTGTSASLTFNGTVTTTGTISSPAWNGQGPSWSNKGTYNGTPGYRTNVPSVTLSIPMTNSHAMIDMPPAGESPTSMTGGARLYNLAQVVLLVSNNLVSMTVQNSANSQVPGADPSPITIVSTNVPSALATNFPFLTMTNFTDQRESKTVLSSQINVGRYAQWLATNANIVTKFPPTSGTYPTILYVGDNRTTTSSQINGVRLVNGQTVPSNGGLGFSVATRDPLYVYGNYNCPNSTYLASTNTSASMPCALMSDAITILSPSWNDAKSSSSYTTRSASANDTINAAILTGVVPSTGSSSSTFSGGVHNLPRLLEDWSSSTLWLNTSIINLFPSQIATHQFINPGTYYMPPTRKFSYDPNFANPNKQPPGIPCALVAIRYNYATPPANCLTYNVTP